MPVKFTHDRSGNKDGPIPKFSFVSAAPCIGDEAETYLLAIRKDWLRRCEEMKTLQKWCGSNQDRDGAKFFKGEAAEAMKFYRAACLLIPHVCAEYPGDCEMRDPYGFPPELFPYLESLERGASHG